MRTAFPNRLRELRGNVNQTEFASKIGVKQTTYSSWERGEKEPDFSTVGRICEIFKVSRDWLFSTSSTSGPEPPVSAPEPTLTINANDFSKLIDAHHQLTVAHKKLAEAHVELARKCPDTSTSKACAPVSPVQDGGGRAHKHAATG